MVGDLVGSFSVVFHMWDFVFEEGQMQPWGFSDTESLVY